MKPILLPTVPGWLLRLAWVLLATILSATGQEARGPLEPPDRSTPSAALQTFLSLADAVGEHLSDAYFLNPSRAGHERFQELVEDLLRGLDLEGLPPAVRRKSGGAAALALYETLARLGLPPWDEIPGVSFAQPPGAPPFDRWVIPRTEITLVRRAEGPRAGAWVFSADTVERAEAFRERIATLPYTRPMPQPRLHEFYQQGGGWMVPYARIEALPEALRRMLWGQPAWKWAALAVVAGLFAGLMRVVIWLAHRFSGENVLRRELLRLLPPAVLLAAIPWLEQFLIVQISLTAGVAGAIQIALAMLLHLAGAWMVWRVTRLVAEILVASPRVAPGSVDAHLIRICTRLLGLVAAAGILAVGADRLGVPVYGIVAGLGVGGLAIALAAQPTIENLIGGLSLFADKPVRVGDFCRYGPDLGVVEEIGIRSTRLRGLDRALTTIPNALFSKMAIVNLSRRDRILLNFSFGLRAGTGLAALRQVLEQAGELLRTHAGLHPEGARVSLNGFSQGALELEVFVYARTTDWNEFVRLRQEVWLRLLAAVAGAGAEVVFPAQTVFLRPGAGATEGLPGPSSGPGEAGTGGPA